MRLGFESAIISQVLSLDRGQFSSVFSTVRIHWPTVWVEAPYGDDFLEIPILVGGQSSGVFERLGQRSNVWLGLRPFETVLLTVVSFGSVPVFKCMFEWQNSGGLTLGCGAPFTVFKVLIYGYCVCIFSRYCGLIEAQRPACLNTGIPRHGFN